MSHYQRSLVLALYRGLTVVAAPFVPLVLRRRQAAGKEDPERRGERLGHPSRPRPKGRLAWIHAASVGEALSVQILLRRLLDRDPTFSVLLTTGTVTSAKLMAERLPDRAMHHYVPVDRMPYVRRFLDHWRPDLVLWVESEIWPNLLSEIGHRQIPAALINARLSERSFGRWKHAPGTIRSLLSAFPIILPWNDATADRLRKLGVQQIGPVGNLKFSADPLPVDALALDDLRSAAGNRPLWLAASTHEGEEQLCAQAHRRLAASVDRPLTVIAPRHPARGPAIAERMTTLGLTATLRSTGALPDADTEIYISDTMGEMGTMLRLSPIVFVGGSLVPHGGHNPIEPAQLASAILYGPHMANFAEITGQLGEADAAVQVADAAGLGDTICWLMSEPAERARLAGAAGAVAARNAGVIDTMMDALEPLLDTAAADITVAGAA